MDFFSAGRRSLWAAAIAGLLAAQTGCGGGSTDEASAADGTAQALAARSARATPTPSPTKGAQTAPAAPAPVSVPPTLTVRAHGSLAGQVGPIMEVRVDGQILGRLEVRSSEPADHSLSAPGLRSGAKVEVAFVNDAAIDGQDRNLFVAYLTDGTVYVAPSQPGVVFDAGAGEQAFDGQQVSPGSEALWGNGALRLAWPAADAYTVSERDGQSSRFLQQATFGPTRAEITRLRSLSLEDWIGAQQALPAQPQAVAHVQAQFDLGPDYRPFTGARYTPDWVAQKFWANAATAPDQLRKRVAWALQNIFVVSQAEANLYHHARAYAAYLDTLDRLAFGNFRTLIEEVALSPAMGIYLSHLRNAKEDPVNHRLPDENFARELMQLFTIGLHELNDDGTPRLDSQGRPIETYNNSDVMALARVFTGWSWGYDDNQLTDHNFFYGTPDPAATGAARVDIRRMKAYPGQWSTAEKRLFSGRPHAVVIPAGTPPNESLRRALDALFAHPNVGPFMSRQLIQRLVTGHPSPAYVQRVAQVFNDNGQGVRGDLGAVVRAILLDTEARQPTQAGFGKIREPLLRVTHWMRSFDTRSASGRYLVTPDLHELQQRVLHMPSVFGYFRPGYVPPAVPGMAAGMTAPEMQIVDESSVALWVNLVELMLLEGLGWHGNVRDVTADLTHCAGLVAQAPQALISHLELLLLGRPASPALRKDLMDAMQGVPEGTPRRDHQRAQVAIFVMMSSPEYLLQR